MWLTGEIMNVKNVLGVLCALAFVSIGGLSAVAAYSQVDFSDSNAGLLLGVFLLTSFVFFAVALALSLLTKPDPFGSLVFALASSSIVTLFVHVVLFF